MVYNCQSSSADQFQKRCLACSSPVQSLTAMFGFPFVSNAYLVPGPVHNVMQNSCVTLYFLRSIISVADLIQLYTKSATLIIDRRE
jgi:hypothetical protein